METFLKILLINCFLWKGIVAPAPVFNLQNCDGGCKAQSDCPTNSACIPVIGQSCGLCLCTVGFALQNGVCQPTATPSSIDGGFGQRVPPKTHSSSSSSSSGGGDETAAAVVPSSGGSSSGQQQPSSSGDGNGDSGGNGGGGVVSLPGPPSSKVTTAQPAAAASGQSSGGSGGSGGDGDDTGADGGSSTGGSSTGKGSSSSGEQAGGGATFDCNKYKCDGQPSKDGQDCVDSPANTVQCPNLAGGGQCMLGSCLRVNTSLSYCLCPYGRQSRTCHVKKTGNCNSADGKLPVEASETKGKRFRHIRDPENGAVLARHAVDSLSDCVKLCQWATYQQCRSVNYGTINGQKICELLTVWANKESILYQWLKDDSDWSYVCCFK